MRMMYIVSGLFMAVVLVLPPSALGQGMPQMPPPEVTTITVEPAEAPVTFDYVGVAEASKTVEIRARVRGFLDSRDFEEGKLVEAGTRLFTIDPRTFEANLKIAEAQVAQAEARLRLAEQEVNRLQSVTMSGAIAESDLDKQRAELTNAAAALSLAKAERDKAELDVSYTVVTAPLKGFVGKALKEIGSFVDEGANSLLTTLSQVDPIYVSFDMSERDYLAWHKMRDDGELKTDGAAPSVAIEFLDGSRYGLQGSIDFESVGVDMHTGTVEMRATLPNPDHLIKPGQFVKAIMEGWVLKNTLMVPQRAVSQSPQGAYVYVVTEEKEAELRIVKPGKWSGDNWIIEEGLKAGEQVIVEGLMKVRPGAVVSPVPAGQAPQTPPASEAKS